MKILCFIQSEDKSINGVSKEALSLSQELCEKNSGELTVLTFDNSATDELSNFSSDKLILGDSPDLQDYNPLFYTSAVEKLIKEHSFDLIILAAAKSDSSNSLNSLLIYILKAWNDFVAGWFLVFFSGYIFLINSPS